MKQKTLDLIGQKCREYIARKEQAQGIRGAGAIVQAALERGLESCEALAYRYLRGKDLDEVLKITNKAKAKPEEYASGKGAVVNGRRLTAAEQAAAKLGREAAQAAARSRSAAQHYRLNSGETRDDGEVRTISDRYKK